MAFTRLTDDLDVIQKLPDLPNDTGGLTADQLKAKYDEAANVIKDYINATLLEQLEGENGAQSIGIYPVEGVNAEDVQRALEILKGQINDATAGAIPDGSIDNLKLRDKTVNTDKIADNAVDTSIIKDEAVTDAKIVSVSGDKITGLISGDNIPDASITADKHADFSVTERKLGAGAVTEPKIGIGAVVETKIAPSAVTESKIAKGAVSKDFTLTLTVDGWTGEEPCTQTVNVTGILDTDEPVVDFTPSTDFETAVAETEAYGLLYDVVTDNGTVTAYATEKPETALNLRLKAVRK